MWECRPAITGVKYTLYQTADSGNSVSRVVGGVWCLPGPKGHQLGVNMWTSIHLQVSEVWDDLLWTCTAIWTDDEWSTPVVLQKSGRTPANGATCPPQMIAAVCSAFASVETVETSRKG
jgi:hypothetical protein